MAINEENNLIGYDPLEWMKGDGEADNVEDQLLSDETGGDAEEQLLDTQIKLTDDYPSDLIENPEEIEIENYSNTVEADIEDPVSNDAMENTEESEISNEIEIEQNSMALEETTENLAADNSVESQIDLAPTLTIQHVVSLSEKLKASLAAHDQIEINASDVVSVDTSTLQLLVSLKKEAAKLQKQVTIIYPSPRFVESAQLLGLSDMLEVHA